MFIGDEDGERLLDVKAEPRSGKSAVVSIAGARRRDHAFCSELKHCAYAVQAA
jgi:hypothetical protein